jgi:hypothetical protein
MPQSCEFDRRKPLFATQCGTVSVNTTPCYLSLLALFKHRSNHLQHANRIGQAHVPALVKVRCYRLVG